MIVPIRRGGTEPPLFCVHPVGGHVYCYAALARRLAQERPVYGIESPLLHGRDMPGDLCSLAREYATAVRALQPHGPWLLAGWSLGGALALETARALHAHGRTIAVLVDSYPPDARVESTTARLVEAFAFEITGYTPAALGIDASLDALLHRARELDLLDPDTSDDGLRIWFDAFASNVKMFASYRPAPFDGEVVMLRASASIREHPNCGWGRVFPAARTIDVDADHRSILAEPAVRLVARHIEGVLSLMPQEVS